jgi:hypothetical protein
MEITQEWTAYKTLKSTDCDMASIVIVIFMFCMVVVKAQQTDWKCGKWKIRKLIGRKDEESYNHHEFWLCFGEFLSHVHLGHLVKFALKISILPQVFQHQQHMQPLPVVDTQAIQVLD